ncbi:hypothetical protein [Georgenia alba]|uniref:Integral membrane protein n=1 Tax=Georgenia alba TaxID=2233858 RepID=A0ABW2Q382_9MICO
MRPGAAVSAACFTLLSVWRVTDGDLVFAGVFAVLALVYLVLALRGPAGRPVARPAGPRAVVAPSPEQAALAAHHRRGWQVIAVVGLVGGVAAVAWFPPLALVLAGCGAYSAHRARALGRTAGPQTAAHAAVPSGRA